MAKEKGKEKAPDNVRYAKAPEYRISKAEIRSQLRQPSSWTPSKQTLSAFYVFAAVNCIAAIYSPIQDCDEVFNYWEPTHYLEHGFGLETWEYSPEYAIRSWAYAGIHTLIAAIGRLAPVARSRVFQFYFLRCALGSFCALCEARLYSKIYQLLNPRIAYIFALIMTTSTGMFHASVAYLPSSFAMYCVMMAMADFMDWRGGLRTAQGIFWIGFGTCLGWPFVGVMVLPFIAEEAMFATLSKDGFIEAATRCMYGTVRTIVAVIVQFNLDLFFYRKIACVPWNIVKYNVLAARQGKGPNIYGTEPWHFYVRNLILNFGLWLPLAVAAMPLLLNQEFVVRRPVTKQSYLRNIIFLIPFYLWVAIFTIQPHKEERFMYPAYPALALNAAIATHISLSYLGSKTSGIISAIPAKLRLALATLFITTTIVFGTLRTAGLVTAYSAPLKVYSPLHDPSISHYGDTLCLGKEWYRYPSDYHLPKYMRAKFIKSEFSGLLPGEFSEAKIGFGVFPGTWLVPAGMNDENKEDLGKYVDVRSCSFLVDSSMSSTPPTKLEPDYVHDEGWERIICEPFLDAAATGLLGRTFWVPDWDVIPERFRRYWGEYCLLKRR